MRVATFSSDSVPLDLQQLWSPFIKRKASEYILDRDRLIDVWKLLQKKSEEPEFVKGCGEFNAVRNEFRVQAEALFERIRHANFKNDLDVESCCLALHDAHVVQDEFRGQRSELSDVYSQAFAAYCDFGYSKKKLGRSGLFYSDRKWLSDISDDTQRALLTARASAKDGIELLEQLNAGTDSLFKASDHLWKAEELARELVDKNCEYRRQHLYAMTR